MCVILHVNFYSREHTLNGIVSEHMGKFVLVLFVCGHLKLNLLSLSHSHDR